MTGARTRCAGGDGAGRRFGSALAAALLVAGIVACDAGAPSEPAPEADAPTRDATPASEPPRSETPAAEPPEPMPPDGQIRLRVDGEKITLHASAAPRRTLLEMLAHELDFALVAPRLGNGPVTIRADAKTLPEILPLLLANRPYRAEYRIDVVNRRHALEQLEVGPPGGDAFALDEILPTVSDATSDPGATPAAGAVVGIDEDAAQVDWKELLLRLDDADAEERIEALAEIDADGEGLALITDRLARDPDPGVRAAAAEQLEFADTLAAVDALVLALGDPDRRVVLAAIDALELTEDTTVVEDLAPLLEHPDPEIREAAQEAIEFIRPDTDDDA